MRMKVLGAAILFCFGSASLSGAWGEVSGVYTSCIAVAHRDVDAKNRCALDELNRQDARMTAAYQQRMKSMGAGDPGQTKLSMEQKKFLKSRDKECGNDNTCQLNLTAPRVDELEREARKTQAE